MKDVLEKITSLYSALEVAVAEYSRLQNVLSCKLEEVGRREKAVDVEKKALAVTEEEISVKTSKIDNDDALKAKGKLLTNLQLNLEDRAKEIAEKEKELAEKGQELDAMREMYRKKDAKLEEQRKELAEDKKKLKESVLEEIKGKL